MSNKITRRNFIQRVAAASVAGPLIVPRLSLAAPPSSRLQHAAIGVGGQGSYDLNSIFSSEKVDVIALCDIDELNLKKMAEKFPQARLYRDWREMLEKEEGKIDSVNVSTPDHTHASATISAVRKGLHVYCEKPLTHDVYEARKVAQAAHKAGVVTQMGNQIHSHEFYRAAVQMIQDGAIGKVTAWHSWCGAIYTRADKNRPEGADPIPASVDWDLWLGTAPERPYKAEIYHPFWWRCFRDFGGGTMGDFGCHIFDPVFTALNIGAPINVSVTPESVSGEVYPEWIEAKWLFPGTPLTAGKTIEATWADGGKQPSLDRSPHMPKDKELPQSGSMIVGEDGTLLLPHVGPPHLYPEEKFVNYPMPVLEPRDHYHEFVNCSLNGGVCGSNFDYAGPLTEAVLLANIANRFPGETLEWNAKKLRFTNHDDANTFLRRKYRKGWKVRGL